MNADVNNFSAIALIAPCPACGSDRINVVRMPEGCKHHAARRCGQCDFFRGWETAPRNQQKRRQRETTISQLLQSSKLTDWEKRFIESLQHKGKLSPRQTEILVRIETKVGGRQ